MLKMFDVVKTTRAITCDAGTLRKGSRGTIVEVYKRAGLKTGYDIEFTDSQGRTKAIVVLTDADIEVDAKSKKIPSSTLRKTLLPAASTKKPVVKSQTVANTARKKRA